MRSPLRPLFPLLWFAFAGCSLLFPKASGLEDVHAIYAEEFAALIVPGPGAMIGTDAGGVAAVRRSKVEDARVDDPFRRTLAAIRQYLADYGEDSREAAHLRVLKGMVYLQSGRPGLAALLADGIAADAPKLASGTGAETRDSLFAANFRDLTGGWREIWKDLDADDATLFDRQALARAADGIAARLDALADAAIADPNVDSGGAYLATSAAIFWLWSFVVGRETDDLGTAGPPPFWEEPARYRREFAQRGADLLRRFLSPEERRIVEDGGSLGEFAARPDGRLRYVEWYAALRQLAAGG